MIFENAFASLSAAGFPEGSSRRSETATLPSCRVRPQIPATVGWSPRNSSTRKQRVWTSGSKAHPKSSARPAEQKGSDFIELRPDPFFLCERCGMSPTVHCGCDTGQDTFTGITGIAGGPGGRSLLAVRSRAGALERGFAGYLSVSAGPAFACFSFALSTRYQQRR